MEHGEYDIFLSYSSKDKDRALRVKECLAAKNYKVWLDAIEVLTGDDIVRKVFEGIKKSRYFAILLTHDSTESKWVREELSAARIRELEEGKVVVLPLLYEDCNIPEALLSKRYADFRRSFPQGLDELENSLRGHELRSGGEVPLATPLQAGPERRLGSTNAKLLDAINGGKNLYMVMDLGGTKAYVSLMNDEAERLFDRRFTTESRDDSEKLFDFIKRCIRDSIDGIRKVCDISTHQVLSRIKAFGIAFAGPTDFERGLILDASNFTIENFPLANRLKQAFDDIPTFIDNDVNLGVLGEFWKGAAQGYRNVVGVIIGTGIGGGIMIDGQIYRGKNKTAGEIGHMILDFDSQKRCGCKQWGCFEVLASRRAIAQNLHEKKSERNATNLIWDEKNLGSNEIADYFKRGDVETVEAVNEAAKICGKAVFSILNLLNPDIILFGGGFVRQLGDAFLKPVREEAKKCMNAVYSIGEKAIPIEVGLLDNPILVGACKMAIDNTTEKEDAKDPITDALVDGLEKKDLELLYSFYEQKMPILISRDSGSSFHEDQLRVLRNRGLIQTVGGQSFKNSNHVQITALGKIIVEGTE
jgi:glucokinase